MANHFSGPQAADDSAFTMIRYRDLVPQNHPVHLIERFVDEAEISHFKAHYKVSEGQKGRAPIDVRLMLKVILYAIYSRIYSAHQIEYATEHFADFWFFTHGKRISHDKISDFINIHGDDIHSIFLATISLASRNELLSFEVLYEDGFKIKANASKKRSYTQKGLDKQEKKLSDRLDDVLNKLQEKKEDDESRKERRKIEKKLSKIRELREELRNRIAENSQNRPPSKAKKIAENSRINMTDSDSSGMKQKDGGHAQSYLKVVASDSKSDIVMDSVISGHDNEVATALPLLQDSNKNCEEACLPGAYKEVVADSRFVTVANCDDFEKADVQLTGPTQTYQHQERQSKGQSNKVTFTYDTEHTSICCSEGQTLSRTRSFHSAEDDADFNVYANPEACAKCGRLSECTRSKAGYREVKLDQRYPASQRSLQRYLSEEGQKLYSKRSHVAETFQGDLKQNGRFLHFYRRGIKKVKVDSLMHDIVWNLRRIFMSKNAEIAWGT